MELFLDKAGGQFIQGKDSLARLDTLRLGENVVEPLKLWLLDRPETAGQALVAAELEAPFTDIIISSRPSDNLELEGNLFSCIDFAAVGAAETLHYEALLQLDTDAVRTALNGRKTLSVLIDVELVNADATRNSRPVMQHPALLYRDIYRGEGAPVPGDPAYPLPANILTVGTDTAQIKRGTVAVANGAESKAIVFGTAFAAAPSTVLAWLMVPAGGALIQCAIDYSTITAAGFTAVFGAATPNADYQLSWLALK